MYIFITISATAKWSTSKPSFSFLTEDGPEEVKITGLSSITEGENLVVTLTCIATEVTPRPLFLWQGQPEDANFSEANEKESSTVYQQSLTFVPKPSQNVKTIRCFVRNSEFGASWTANASFRIHFSCKSCRCCCYYYSNQGLIALYRVLLSFLLVGRLLTRLFAWTVGS